VATEIKGNIRRLGGVEGMANWCLKRQARRRVERKIFLKVGALDDNLKVMILIKTTFE